MNQKLDFLRRCDLQQKGAHTEFNFHGKSQMFQGTNKTALKQELIGWGFREVNVSIRDTGWSHKVYATGLIPNTSPGNIRREIETAQEEDGKEQAKAEAENRQKALTQKFRFSKYGGNDFPGYFEVLKDGKNWTFKASQELAPFLNSKNKGSECYYNMVALYELVRYIVMNPLKKKWESNQHGGNYYEAHPINQNPPA